MGASLITLLLGPIHRASAQTSAPASCIQRGHHARITLPATTNAKAAVLYFKPSGGVDGWYSVPAERAGNHWIAVLPQANTASRVHYRLVETDLAGTPTARRPARGAFLADVVVQPCTTGTAAIAPAPSITLTVPRGSPRVPPGFVDTNIVAFIAAPETATPSATPKRRVVREQRLALRKGSVLRITRSDGSRTSGTVLRADRSGVRFEGRRQVVPWADVTRVEEYEGPGAGRRVLGALAGLGGGFALSIVYFVASKDVDSPAPLYIGTMGGALIGALVVGGRYRTLAQTGRTVLRARSTGAASWLARRAYVAPRPGGASAGIGLSF